MADMKNPKVSVIMPVYNAEKFLRRALDTVCAQTLREIEIICVDDGSSDASPDILREYAARDGRIKILRHEHTGMGAGGARNMGIDYAKGEFLSFLDADDYFDLSLLEKSCEKAERYNADVVMFDAQRFHSASGGFIQSATLKREYLPEKNVFSWRDFPDYVFQAPIGTAWAMLIRRELVLKNELRFQSVYYTDDFFFSYSVLLCAGRVTVIDEKLVYYRVNHAESQSSNRDKSPLSALEACKELKRWMEERGDFELFRRSFINRAADFIRWYLNSLSEFAAFSELFDTLKERGLAELGLSAAAAEDFYDPSLYMWINRVQSAPRDEYLFEMKSLRTGFQYNTRHSFPDAAVTAEERVVLYSSGDIGRAYYIENMVRRHCKIVQWLDRDFEAVGAPAESPENFGTKAYDKILIAAEKAEEYESIRRELICKGISEECVVWPFAGKR